MTTVDDKLIEKLEKLSSLKLDDNIKGKMKEDISQMLEFVENLNEIDVSNIKATSSTIEGGTPLREDLPIQNLELSKHILKHAPKTEDSYFVVPKILE